VSLREAEALAPERTLAPDERVQALLDRMALTNSGRDMHPDDVTELATVPGSADILVGLARDPSARLRLSAVVLIGQLRTAAGLPDLQAVLAEAIPPAPRPPDDALREPAPKLKSPAELPAYRRRWEAWSDRPMPPHLASTVEAHAHAVELNRAATHALSRFAWAK
jgi:hypothetical protein